MRLKRSVWACAVAVAATAALGLAACERRAPPGPTAADGKDSQDRQRIQAQQQLASLGARASGATRALYEGEFTASGSLELGTPGEGAWVLHLLDDYAQLERPGLGEEGGPTTARDYREQGMRVTAGPLIITIRAENCPLPSGDTLPYTASVLFEGFSYQGCARRGVATGVDRGTWASGVLLDLLPAIDACLRRAESRPARVTIASNVGDGEVSVRLRQADGGRYACNVTADGSRIITYDPLLDSDSLHGEGDPEFVRAPGNPPRASNCRSITEVTAPAPPAPAAPDDAGKIQQSPPTTIGWLIRRSCP
jgi:hypothetical protein